MTSEYHKTISNILLNYLNISHFKEIYNNRINSFISIDFLNRGLLLNLRDENTNDNPTGQFLNFLREQDETPIWVG